MEAFICPLCFGPMRFDWNGSRRWHCQRCGHVED